MNGFLLGAGSALLAFVVLVASHAVNTAVTNEYPAWGPRLAAGLLRVAVYLMPRTDRVGWLNDTLSMLNEHRTKTGTAGIWFASEIALGMPAAAWTARRMKVTREPPGSQRVRVLVSRPNAQEVLCWLTTGAYCILSVTLLRFVLIDHDAERLLAGGSTRDLYLGIATISFLPLVTGSIGFRMTADRHRPWRPVLRRLDDVHVQIGALAASLEGAPSYQRAATEALITQLKDEAMRCRTLIITLGGDRTEGAVEDGAATTSPKLVRSEQSPLM